MATVEMLGIVPGSISSTVGIESNYRSLEFICRFNEAVNNSDQAIIDAGNYGINNNLPIYPGAAYPYNNTLRATDINGTQDANNARVWRFNVSYDAIGVPIIEGFGYGFQSNCNLITEAAKGAYWFSKDKKAPNSLGEIKPDPTVPILNSAEDPYGEPLQATFFNPMFSWWQIENKTVGKTIDDLSIYDYMGTVNLKPVTICGKPIKSGQAILRKIQPELYYYRNPNNVTAELRWKTTYTIEISKKGTWIDSVLDQGYQSYLRKSQADSTLVKRDIKRADVPYNTGEITQDSTEDEYVNQPQKLNGVGQLLPDGDDPVYMNYLVKEMKDWSGLSLATKIATPTNIFPGD